jgi:hypothetical protein
MESNTKRLFISHASEDKSDFVRPLAEALRRHYQVWYDEYELVVGDSLLKKIDAGLRSCDYGVVVLSPSFFQKKWPQAELDGLFALETTTRKIILPVWKDVSQDDVTRFSPILAGRLATNASEGIDKVVNDLRRAVEVSDRVREVSASDSVIQKARSIDQTLQERANADRLSRCEEGVAIVRQGFDCLNTYLEKSIGEILKTSKHLGLKLSYQPDFQFGPTLMINTSHQHEMHAELRGLGGNFTYEATLVCAIFKRGFPRPERPAKVREVSFKPTFNLSNYVLWIQAPGRQTQRTEELAAHLLDLLLTELEKQSNR